MVTAVLGGSHYYIAKRLVIEPGVAEPLANSLLAVVVAGALSLVAAPIAERTLPPERSRWIAWPSSLWMGFGFWLLVFTAISDALLGLMTALGVGPVVNADAGALAEARAAAVVVAVLLAGGFGLRSGLAPPHHKRVDIELANWPAALNGFRIAQISDIHIGPILGRRFARHIVDRVNALDVDLVAVTGDLVDGPVEKLAEEVAPFRDLKSQHGVYFVTGNHDHYSGVVEWVEKAGDLGMHVLRNDRTEIRAAGGVFDLVGVDDYRGNMTVDDGREDLPKALAGRDAARPAVLLAHDPSTFRRARVSGIDLQLSGHTHGGQIWPFGYLVRLAIRHVAGLYRENGSTLYVSRGTGFWGPPMRLFAPAEITELVIRGPH
jgi:hypothetical protein